MTADAMLVCSVLQWKWSVRISRGNDRNILNIFMSWSSDR